MSDRIQHLNRFYEQLQELEALLDGKQFLQPAHGRMNWSPRGVYFFFEGGEYRANPYSDQLRVVRVGTHAVSQGSKSTLWGRLKSHKGSDKGGGNHRGSIFRLHVGAALIQQSQGKLVFPQWGQGSNAPREIRHQEIPLEQLVSNHIGQMPFLWIAVNDEPSANSQRSIIERNAIILLAGNDGASPVDPPSPTWLGHQSTRDKIRQSGLWNLNYVANSSQHLEYDPSFLEVMDLSIQAMKST